MGTSSKIPDANDKGADAISGSTTEGARAMNRTPKNNEITNGVKTSRSSKKTVKEFTGSAKKIQQPLVEKGLSAAKKGKISADSIPSAIGESRDSTTEGTHARASPGTVSKSPNATKN